VFNVKKDICLTFPNFSTSSLANDGSMLVNLGFPRPCTAASEETEEKLDEDGDAGEEEDEDEPDHVQQEVLHPGELEGGRSEMLTPSMTYCMLDPPNSCVLSRQRSIHE